MSTTTKTTASNPDAPAHGYAAEGKANPVVPPHDAGSPSNADYTAAEVEFMNAVQAYKASSGRMFPTWSEVLEVLKGLGYAKG
jgi:hypothetical protein